MMVSFVNAYFAFFAVLHGFEHIFFAKKTLLFSKFSKFLISQKMNIPDSGVEKLRHQKANQEANEHKSVNRRKSECLFGRVFRLMLKIMVVMQEVNTDSVEDGAENDEEGTAVPFLVDEKPG